jgi:Uma2 family endonuclease
MAAVQTRAMTLEEFEQFIYLPENVDHDFEFVGGRPVEVVSDQESSRIAAALLIRIGMYLLSNDIGRVTGADGGYFVMRERYMPDVGYISYTRQPEPFKGAYNTLSPDLAVEVLSPTNDAEDMRLKITNYLLANTVVWLVNPDKKRVEVYVPGQPPEVLTVEGTLDGGAILPGFQLAVKDIFPEKS